MRIVIYTSLIFTMMFISGCLTESKTCTLNQKSSFCTSVNQGAQLFQEGYQVYSVHNKRADTNWYALEDNSSVSDDSLLFCELDAQKGSSFEVGLMLNGAVVQKETVRIIQDPQDDCHTIGEPDQVIFTVE